MAPPLSGMGWAGPKFCCEQREMYAETYIALRSPLLQSAHSSSFWGRSHHGVPTVKKVQLGSLYIIQKTYWHCSFTNKSHLPFPLLKGAVTLSTCVHGWLSQVTADTEGKKRLHYVSLICSVPGVSLKGFLPPALGGNLPKYFETPVAFAT